MEAPVPPISPRNSRFVTTNQRNAQPASELFDATIRHASGQIPGYAGYVRGARHYHGRTYTKVTAAAVEDPRGRRDRFPAPASPGSPPRSPRTDMPGYAGFVAGSKFKYSKTRGAQIAELASEREAESVGISPDTAAKAPRPLTSEEGHVPGIPATCRATDLFGMTRREDARVDRARAARRDDARADARGLPRDGHVPGYSGYIRGSGATTRGAPKSRARRRRCPRRLPSLLRGRPSALETRMCAAARRPARPWLCRPRGVCALAALSPPPSARSTARPACSPGGLRSPKHPCSVSTGTSFVALLYEAFRATPKPWCGHLAALPVVRERARSCSHSGGFGTIESTGACGNAPTPAHHTLLRAQARSHQQSTQYNRTRDASAGGVEGNQERNRRGR